MSFWLAILSFVASIAVAILYAIRALLMIFIMFLFNDSSASFEQLWPHISIELVRVSSPLLCIVPFIGIRYNMNYASAISSICIIGMLLNAVSQERARKIPQMTVAARSAEALPCGSSALRAV